MKEWHIGKLYSYFSQFHQCFCTEMQMFGFAYFSAGNLSHHLIKYLFVYVISLIMQPFSEPAKPYVFLQNCLQLIIL